MTEQLAVWSSRRPRLTLAGWALALRREGATQLTTDHDSGERRLVSGDRDATGMLVALRPRCRRRRRGCRRRGAARRRSRRIRRIDHRRVHALDADLSTLAEEDLRNGELG